VAEYQIPDDLRYTEQDEWARPEDGRIVVGVTDYAQQQLGDIVFVELPELGTRIEKGSAFGVIESVKAVSDLYAPLGGEIVARNDGLTERPELVNEDCYGDGWIVAIASDESAASLLDAGAYRRHVEERGE
jgi:glycine cleavage system H protein